MKLLTFIGILCLLIACNDNSNNNNSTQKSAPATTETTPTATPPPPSLPVYPKEKVQQLFTNVDYVDYLFYEIPVSMSLSDPESISYVISHIPSEPAKGPSCKAIGRIFYQQNGENISEADIHFNANIGCRYLVFYEGGKKAYISYLNDKGVNYLTSNISRVLKGMQQGKPVQ